jgi:hypothetical protein
MDSKPWYKSLGVITGAILTVLILVLPIAGQADLGGQLAEEQTGIIAWFADLDAVIAKIMLLVTNALALYGRLRAKTRITPT